MGLLHSAPRFKIAFAEILFLIDVLICIPTEADPWPGDGRGGGDLGSRVRTPPLPSLRGSPNFIQKKRAG